MTKTVKIAAALLVAVCLAGWVWYETMGTDPRPPSVAAADSVDLAETIAAPSSSAADLSAGSGERTAVSPAERVERSAAGAPAILRGRVLRMGDDCPLEGVAILVQRGTERPVEGTRSGPDGGFRLVPAPGVEEALVFEHAEYLTRTSRPDGIPRGEDAFLEMHLPALGTLEVLVVDALGIAVPDVPVTCQPPPVLGAGGLEWKERLASRRDARSDEFGLCRLENLPCGVPLLVSLDWFGFQPDTELIEIDPVMRSASVRLERLTLGRISGSVLDAEGSPAQVEVRLQLSEIGMVMRDVRTDEDGRFQFDDVPPRRIIVAPQAPGLEMLTVLLEPGQELVLDPFRIPEGGVLSGRIRSRFAIDASQLTVEVVRRGETLGERIFPGSEGSFTATVSPGPVLVRVLQSRVRRVKVPSGGWEKQLGDDIGELARIEAEAPREELEIWIDAGAGVIEGTVPPPEGDAGAPQLTILFEPEGPLSQYGARSRIHLVSQWIGDWRFQSPPLLAGTFAVSVRGPDGSAFHFPEVVVRAGVATDLGLLQATTHTLRGRVENENGDGLVDAVVTLGALGLDRPDRRAVSDAEGSFELRDLEAARYIARADLPEVGTSGQHVVDVGGGDERVTLVVLSSARISGRVERGGSPLPNERVMLGVRTEDRAVYMQEMQVTDAERDFAFEDLVPGWYMVSSEMSAYRWVELGPGDDRRVDLSLGETGGELRVYFRGVPLREGTGLDYGGIERGSDDFGVTRFFNVGPGGLVPYPDLAGRLLLRAWCSEYPDANLVAWVEGTGATRPARVDFCDGELVLDSTVDRDAAPPTLWLLSIDGVADGTHAVFPLQLPRVFTGGAWRYIGVPEHATLRLDGHDGSGHRQSREFRSPDRFPEIVPWP